MLHNYFVRRDTSSAFTAVVLVLSWIETAKGRSNPNTGGLCPAESSTYSGCHFEDRLGGAVQCDDDDGVTSLLQGYCMTYAGDSNLTLNIGRCPLDHFEVQLYNNFSGPNEAVAGCEAANKTGFMCSMCLPGHCLSYTLDDYGRCIPCNSSSLVTSWIAFIALQLVPPTVIYFAIVFARIRATSPHLHLVILFCQMMAYPRPSNLITVQATLSTRYQKYLFVIYNLWNMKLTAPLVPELGLEGLTFFWASLANYIICLYLLALATTTYILVRLHDRGFKPVVIILLPLRACANWLYSPWRLRGTFIDVLVTMMVLVYWKLATTTLAILSSTTTYDSSGTVTGVWHYFDASEKYFDFSGAGGLPAIMDLLALCMLVFLLLPPFILACFQFKLFHDFLNKCTGRRFRTFQLYIKTFSDTLQSCFKDGTNGTGDYRFFASLSFLIRLIGAYIYNTEPLWSSPVLAMLFLALLVFVCFLQPHKRSAYNTLDAAVFGAFVLIHLMHTALGMQWALSQEYSPRHGDTVRAVVAFKCIATLLLTLPLFYFAMCVAYQLVFKSRILSRIFNKARDYRERWQLQATAAADVNELITSSEVTSHGSTLAAESFPHRMANPEDYGSLNVEHAGIPNRNVYVTVNTNRTDNP